jgi:hypothetical protein
MTEHLPKFKNKSGELYFMKEKDLKDSGSVIGFVLLALGLFQSIGTLWLFPTCGAKDDGSYMKCHWTGQTLIALGAVVVIMAVIYLFAKSKSVRGGIALSVIPVGLMTIAVPNFLIGVCGMPNMQCHAFTLPINTIIGAVSVGLGVLSSIYLLHKNDERGALQNGKGFTRKLYQ